MISLGACADVDRIPQRARVFDKSGSHRGLIEGSTVWLPAPSNPELLICNHRLFAVRAKEKRFRSALGALLNSTVVAFFKHYYGRYAGMEHTLDTEVVDV